MLSFLLNILYPPQCRSCEAITPPGAVFCSPCLQEIQPIVTLRLPVAKKLVMPVHALSAYTPPLRFMVLKKFHNDRLASQQLAQLILRMPEMGDLHFDAVIPVPLHWTRYAWRGFNQACEMARVIARERKVPLLRCVVRTRRTQFQWQLSAEERRHNVKQVFGLHPWYRWHGTDALMGKHILLVDDLCTTGATLIQVAKVLARYQPASITAVVACRAV